MELLNKIGGSTDIGVAIDQRRILLSGVNILCPNPMLPTHVSRLANVVFGTWFNVFQMADGRHIGQTLSVSLRLFAKYSNWTLVLSYLFNYLLCCKCVR